MSFNYSRYESGPRPDKTERFLEILPGALSWSIIIGICVLSVLTPLTAAVIMIAFLLYWLLRLIYMNIFLILSYIRLAIEKETDWMGRITALDQLCTLPPENSGPLKRDGGLKTRISDRIHRRQVMELKKSGAVLPQSTELYQLVIIPVIRESLHVVEPGIRAIREGMYPAKRFFIIIALEEAAPESVKADMSRLQKKYRGHFYDFFITVHPQGLPGEARVKGANVTFAAKKAAAYFSKHAIPFKNVLVSCFDADTVANPHYFSCLTYHYMINPDRARSSYQPVPVYHNNIWQAPGFARILDIGTSFFQLIEATNPETLVTFSSHSMSFKALHEVGYWPVDMISDDSAIFWKAFLHYDGHYRVVPIYTTVSMDIASGPTTTRTLLNIYKQKRRWAWGIENFPIVIRGFLRSKKISLFQKLTCGYKLLDSFISWATWSFLLLFGSWLPAFFATQEFSSSVLYYTAPRISGTIYWMASAGLVICMVISLMLLPKCKIKNNIFVRIAHIFEWLLIPVVLLFLSALPALDALTRLMLGRRMEFWVADKRRK